MDNTIITFIVLLVLSSLFVGGLYIYYAKPMTVVTETKADKTREIANTCDDCKCYVDAPNSGSGDTEYQRLQSKDNKTFCGKMVDNVLYGCKENCCKEKCV